MSTDNPAEGEVSAVTELPRRRARRNIVYASDWMIWQVLAEDYRDPIRVLLVGAARLWLEKGHTTGFLNRAQRAWKEAVELAGDRP